MTTKSTGFWMPRELFLDSNLTFTEKFLLIEIGQLTMLDKGCIASNHHFAELLDIKKTAVSRALNSLASKKYVDIEISDRNHSRKITINNLLTPLNNSLPPVNNLLFDPLTNCEESKESNSKVNNTVNKRAPAKQIPDMTRKAIQYLEEKAQRQFSADHKWLEYFRNDINKLYASLKGDDRAERILKVLEWYSTSDSPTVIISGRDLDEKFNKLESQMNFKPFDEQKPKPKFVHPPETIHNANPPHTRPGIGEWNGDQS